MITQAASHPVTLEALRSRHGESYKWIVLATVMVGMMASALSARGIPQAASVISGLIVHAASRGSPACEHVIPSAAPGGAGRGGRGGF